MNAPAFNFYAQDFLTGCMYLTNEEVGIYIKMLAKQWTDGKIPKKRLGFLVGLEWVSFSDELKSKFDDFGDYVLNKRLETEREKKQNFRQKQVENGKKGGRPPKKKPPETLSNKENSENTEEKKSEEKNKNPNLLSGLSKTKAKKSLLEIENEIEIENEEEKEKGGTEEKTLNFHFDSEIFRTQWKIWKAFRKKKDKFQYFDIDSEQRALTELFNLSNGNEKTAIKIIQKSIDSGWKGFFKLKENEQSDNQNTNNGFSNSSGNSRSNQASGKISASAFIAGELEKFTSGNSESGNITIDAETL